MPTTEIVTCTLRPNSAIGNPSNHAAVVLRQTAETLSRQEGFEELQFGMQTENPEVIQLMIKWTSLPLHQKFQTTPSIYEPFLSNFASITASSPLILHADFHPSEGLSASLAAPVTEIATFYFPPEGEPEAYLSNALRFREILETASSSSSSSSSSSDGHDGDDGVVEGYMGSSIGLSHESDLAHGGRAAVLVVGWKSVEAHMQFRTQELFKQNIGKLREGSVGVEMHHVQFMKFVPEE